MRFDVPGGRGGVREEHPREIERRGKKSWCFRGGFFFPEGIEGTSMKRAISFLVIP